MVEKAAGREEVGERRGGQGGKEGRRISSMRLEVKESGSAWSF